MVVNDMSEMIGRESIGLEQDGILQPRIVKFDSSANDVFAKGFACQRHFEADDIGHPRSFQPRHSLRRGVTIAAVITAPGLTHGFKFFRAGKALVGMAMVNQPMRPFLIQFKPFGLNIGAVITAMPRAFINIHPQPVESLKDEFEGARDKTFAVGIFDAQDKLTAMTAGE